MDNLLAQMGSRILKRRKQLRMTQEELAEKAGVMPQTISTAELGKKALRPENIVRICTALDISTDYLLMGKNQRSITDFIRKENISVAAGKDLSFRRYH